MTHYHHRLYFSARTGFYGQELWEFNGADPPEMVVDINPGPSGSKPNNLIVFDDKLYFSADDGFHGKELWSLFLDVTGERKLEKIKRLPDRFLHCYPNPTHNLLTIETEYPDHYFIEIKSLNGLILLSGEYEGTIHQHDLSSFERGAYLITIRSKDFVTTRKIIKL